MTSPEGVNENERRERFARRMMAALQAAGETRDIRYDPEEFRLVLAGESDSRLEFNLTNAYAEYRAAPREQRRAVVHRYVQAGRSVDLPPGFAEVRPHLLPRVRKRSFYASWAVRFQIDELPPRPLVYQPFAEHLAVGLAYDMPDRIVEVWGDQFQEWGVGTEEAFAIARDNLRRMSEGGFRSAAPGVWFSPWCDNHDASRVVLDDLVRDCEVKGDYVALVPNRDTLLLTGSEDVAGLMVMLQVGEQVLTEKPRPMSGIPILLRQGVWAPFAPDVHYPELVGYRALRLRTEAMDYGEQKEMLDQLHQKLDDGPFVASFSVIQNKQTGAVRSYCVWSEGVTTLLPRTDKVFFVQPGKEGDNAIAAGADWEHVCSVAGDRMRPTDHYPPRFLVESFPTARELKALGMEGPA